LHPVLRAEETVFPIRKLIQKPCLLAARSETPPLENGAASHSEIDLVPHLGESCANIERHRPLSELRRDNQAVYGFCLRIACFSFTRFLPGVVAFNGPS
jgi:hypothetical protein